jgi:exopolyphosphatase/guanosine-5'-triphosphate,3'-diphosphate pyrophosphatase
LIAELDGHGTLRDVVRALEVVRLGKGVDRTGRFSQAALNRTLAAARTSGELWRGHGAERIRFVATSATREAANCAEFTDAVRPILGVPVEVITGTEEAALSFRGTAPESAYSMDIGRVRLAERTITSDPSLESELAAIRSAVTAALDIATATVGLSRATEVIGVAGTVTTITAHALGLNSSAPEAIRGSRLPLADVLDSCKALSGMPRAERAADRRARRILRSKLGRVRTPARTR